MRRTLPVLLAMGGSALAADPENGLAVAEAWCNGCHIVRQKDTGQDDGAPAPRFSLLTKHDVASVTALLRKGHASMDALSKIPDGDIADIVAHLHRLKPEEQ
jgi:mono/diheme cytochrome c family protein